MNTEHLFSVQRCMGGMSGHTLGLDLNSEDVKVQKSEEQVLSKSIRKSSMVLMRDEFDFTQFQFNSIHL